MPIYNPTTTGGWNTIFPTTNPVSPVSGNTIIWPASTGVSGASVQRKRRVTVWMKAINELRSMNGTGPEAVSVHYKSISPNTVISVLGKINPVYRGRPKQLPMKLLEAAAFPSRDALFYVSSGLTYSDTWVAGKYKQKGRLTAAGLKLLEHWATVYPSFKPFFEAYVPKKARKQIMADAFDLEMGVLPKRVQELKAKHDQILANEAEIIAKAANIEAKKRQYVAKRSSGNATAYQQAIMQQQQLLLQQQLNSSNHMAMNNILYGKAG